MLDAHLHYGSEHLYARLDHEARKARAAGVRWVVNAPVDFESSCRAFQITDAHTGCVMDSWVVRRLLGGAARSSVERFSPQQILTVKT